MLDLVKLSGQIPGLTQHLQQEAKASQKRLQQALHILEQLQQEPQVWQSRYADWGSHLSFTCASPAEPPQTWGSQAKIEPLKGRHTVVATDGSQIVPNHHEIAYCSLINVGRVVLHYGTQQWPLLDSLPVLLYRSAELQHNSGLRAEEVLALRRTQAEWEELAQLALAVPRRRTTLALVDGSLIPWGLESLAAEEQRLWLDPLLAVLERLRAARIPLVGYISASRSSETVNYLRLGLCPFLSCECHRYCSSEQAPPCQPFAPLPDRIFWGSLLQPGERSPIWRSGAKVLAPFGEHHIHCCYLNVSQGSLEEAEIARVEFPAWVAQDAQLLQRALAGVLSQVQKGFGYPVALAEAHHLAVVRGGDRQRFFALIEQELIRTGLRNVAVSRKEAQKRGGIA
ncbi:DNA double-strand break repair nuclease NurA [Thermostichus vulcanus]|uniref:DNA double-strand break repair nuclease NurA n=1 Tax=Thermostichus vulcanus str. 'Rupite' TaxID=2813851 RepID=A0ABT0C853_THEVL|nr:DNA double-strand break repair nuclease NurA [Thermostichus vulcanus]MCJ2541965.1 DNA double-strand break repair nuclease NurA [Thermostichus vulcanus str. 'Rupite']